MPYNPQQNVVAERMNLTILNMFSSMMFLKNVKLTFGIDVVLCVVYVKNKCQSHTLRNKTPYEMWSGHIPLVRHLSVFGSTFYASFPKEKRYKLYLEVYLIGVFKYHQCTSSLRWGKQGVYFFPEMYFFLNLPRLTKLLSDNLIV